MSGRGRGRGRGGISKSFNKEQLNSLGVVSNEFLPGPVTQPPVLYPILDRKPTPLMTTRETDYLLILKQDFIDHMQLSGSYVTLPCDKKQPELEIDKLVAQIPRAKEHFDFSLFPHELRPRVMAKRIRRIKTEPQIDVVEKLAKLEKIEQGSSTKPIKQETEDSDGNEELEDEPDEEMDDGTDYANNYFNNGEDYEDEDDNLDDGPIF